MLGRPCVARYLTFLFLLTIVTVGAAPPVWAKKMTLPQLLEMARGNPGLQASAAATSASEAQVIEAKLNWLPQGDLLSVLAPSPNIHCTNPLFSTTNPGMNFAGTTQTDPCLATTSPEARITD